MMPSGVSVTPPGHLVDPVQQVHGQLDIGGGQLGVQVLEVRGPMMAGVTLGAGREGDRHLDERETGLVGRAAPSASAASSLGWVDVQGVVKAPGEPAAPGWTRGRPGPCASGRTAIPWPRGAQQSASVLRVVERSPVTVSRRVQVRR